MTLIQMLEEVVRLVLLDPANLVRLKEILAGLDCIRVLFTSLIMQLVGLEEEVHKIVKAHQRMAILFQVLCLRRVDSVDELFFQVGVDREVQAAQAHIGTSILCVKLCPDRALCNPRILLLLVFRASDIGLLTSSICFVEKGPATLSKGRFQGIVALFRDIVPRLWSL